jgi:hypothetical protein
MGIGLNHPIAGSTSWHSDVDQNWTKIDDNFPLTTKGDIFVYSTVNTRLPVGTDGQYLKADSAEATGLKWSAAPSYVKWLGFSGFVPVGTYESNGKSAWLKSSLGFSDKTMQGGFSGGVPTAGSLTNEQQLSAKIDVPVAFTATKLDVVWYGNGSAVNIHIWLYSGGSWTKIATISSAANQSVQGSFSNAVNISFTQGDTVIMAVACNASFLYAFPIRAALRSVQA